MKKLLSCISVCCVMIMSTSVQAQGSETDAFGPYRYYDGNNNLYTLSGDTLSYTPMKPEKSSSGTYDGGEAQQVVLSKAASDSIKSWMWNHYRINAKERRKRTMGSGKVVIIGPKKKMTTYIMAYGSSERKELEKLLKSALKED